MDRRCFGCASKFSIFKKECGCKSCGHSFCAGCLGFSAVLPQYGNTKQKVCRRCHESISSGENKKNDPSKWSPPENYKKRVAALEAKTNQSKGVQIAPGASHIGTGSSYHGLSAEDRAIAERLERLRKEYKPKAVPSTAEIESRLEALKKDPDRKIPSAEEMEDRLAALQGRTPVSRTQRQVHQPPDTRTQVQKTDDLLTQLKEEVAIDQNFEGETSQSQDFSAAPKNDLSRVDGKESWAEMDPAQLEEEKNKILSEAASELKDENTRAEKLLEIAKRLAVLQGRDPDKVTADNYKLPDSDEETEEEAIQRVLKQLSEEVVLDEASGFNIPPDQNRPKSDSLKMPAGNKPHPKEKVATKSQPPTSREADSDEEELPWCCICNEDAILKCHDCDDDLYCKRCFKEGHDEFDRKEHRTSSYKAPKKKRGR
ncbi:abscission/NoCut checkpoint regulator [Xenopus laevis]|uniref:Abscission/NoCut checkpoint regulator n=2 Tax=Xenopus laevis TaxID=8355 RepID=A0A1L8FB21_XENLA|nr:abscission/NoCut checkpoint regulator [Xenopus laevis]XP_018086735.1 abscission/NoCut checkpoint regulator [Xenopus laevis]XP_018086736.1 abscission/NoCut checkpoint regulator [Xenopus laevis]OCT68781.1 hypothetical protein XELAEV_18040072mg [Xenopus laevis]